MKVHLVYWHNEPQSFNHALLELAQIELGGMGHEVLLSDLFEMDFKARADRHDFGHRLDMDFFKYQTEQRHNLDLNALSADIAAEQKKLASADLLILQFPLWWLGFPAVMKGWVDRVLSSGFAYGSRHLFSKGYMKNKRALLSLTTGGPRSFYEEGPQGPIEPLLYPIQHGTLYFCGFQVLKPQVSYAVDSASPAERETLLEDYAKRLQGIFEEEPLSWER